MLKSTLSLAVGEFKKKMPTNSEYDCDVNNNFCCYPVNSVTWIMNTCYPILLLLDWHSTAVPTVDDDWNDSSSVRMTNSDKIKSETKNKLYAQFLNKIDGQRGIVCELICHFQLLLIAYDIIATCR